MHVGFDASALETATTGAGEYQRNLLDALLALPHGPRLTVYTPSGETLAPHPRLAVRPLPWPPGGRARRILQGAVTLRRRWAADKLDLLHVPIYYLPPGAPPASVLTAHDIRFAHDPGSYPLARLLFLRATVPWSLHRARHVIAVSEFTKRDLIASYGLPPEKITVTHEAARPAFRPITNEALLARVRAEYRLPERFVLCVGTLEPRKNLVRAVEALARLRDRGLPHHLVLAGMPYFRHGPIGAAIARSGLAERVHLLGPVPDGDLPGVYALADCFLYPSLYEGFGIPVLEAMACGTPVAASNATSIPEVAGEAALLFDPHDAAAMADAMARILEDPATATRLKGAGLERAAAFSWERTARETLEVYRRVAAEAAP